MDYEEHIRVLSYDVLSEEINGLRIEISELKNKEFDLECEVKRLREAIADVAKNMQAADPVYLQGFIKDLYEVIG